MARRIDGVDTIELPPDCCTDATGVADPFEEIGRRVSPEIETMFGDARYLIEGSILAAENEDVDRINCASLKRFTGESVGLKSQTSYFGKAAKASILQSSRTAWISLEFRPMFSD